MDTECEGSANQIVGSANWISTATNSARHVSKLVQPLPVSCAHSQKQRRGWRSTLLICCWRSGQRFHGECWQPTGLERWTQLTGMRQKSRWNDRTTGGRSRQQEETEGKEKESKNAPKRARARREGQHISADVSRTLEPSMLKKRVKMKTVDDVIHLYICQHEAACCRWWKDDDLLQHHVKMEVFSTVVANMSSRSVDLSTVSPLCGWMWMHDSLPLLSNADLMKHQLSQWLAGLVPTVAESLPSEHFCEIVKKHNSKEKSSYQNGTDLLGFYSLLL